MYTLSKFMFEREQFLTRLIHSKKKALEHAPEGCLRVCPRGRSVHYYLRSGEYGPNGKYLSKDQLDLAHVLAQKKYDLHVLHAAEKERQILSRLNHLYQSRQTPEDVFLKESEVRQKIIAPIEPTDKMYVDKWLSEPFEQLESHDKPAGYFSDNNEQMRSKSEVLIANMLKKNKIPYRYECALKLNNRTVFPDFTVLNVRDRKEMYWEHFGLLDDPDYLEKSLAKVTAYELSGYYPGDRLIISFETTRQPLDMRLIEKIIALYFR